MVPPRYVQQASAAHHQVLRREGGGPGSSKVVEGAKVDRSKFVDSDMVHGTLSSVITHYSHIFLITCSGNNESNIYIGKEERSAGTNHWILVNSNLRDMFRLSLQCVSSGLYMES